MNACEQEHEAFLQRVLRWQDGSLASDELEALEKEMMASGEKRRLFAELQMRSALMNELLRREAYAGSAQIPVVSIERGIIYRFRWAMVAAAMIGAALIVARLIVWKTPDDDGQGRGPDGARLAQITFGNDAEWGDGRVPLDGRLAEGTYSLASGIIRLALAHDGTIATLAGPARFDLAAPGNIRLHEGRLSAKVSQPDRGFTIFTDALTVLDRGTVFGVDVRPDGEALVSVLEGKVDVHEPGSHEVQRIEQGGRLTARPKGKRLLQPAEDVVSGFEDLWPLTLGVDDLSHLVDFVIPRARHKWNDYRSDTRLYLMPERQRVKPESVLNVDIAPGAPLERRKHARAGLPLPLESDVRVNSFLLFFRPLENAAERSPEISGSITFAQPVLGIITDGTRLIATDDTLGHPRVLYRDKPRRGIEKSRKPSERDVVRISRDGRRIYFNLHTTADPDEFRVLVAAP